jgi:hypothetical protein
MRSFSFTSSYVLYCVERVVRSTKGRSLRKRGLGTVETDARAIIISYENGNAPNLGSLQVCMWEPALRGITGLVLYLLQRRRQRWGSVQRKLTGCRVTETAGSAYMTCTKKETKSLLPFPLHCSTRGRPQLIQLRHDDRTVAHIREVSKVYLVSTGTVLYELRDTA